jgi:hypothetical protein
MPPFVRRAWRAGIFRTVQHVSLNLNDEEERGLLIDGVVSGVESIGVGLSNEAPEVERAALGHLRHFPALKDISCFTGSDDTALPLFIPPSLEALTFCLYSCKKPVRLLGSLPPMISSSGAGLRRLRRSYCPLGDEGTARGVMSLLQACASTLNEVNLTVSDPFESAVEVVEGLASCQHLERVEAPISTFAIVPPGGTTFRLVSLRLTLDCRGVHRALLSLALWGLMARGGLPTLEGLSVDCYKWRWVPELGPAVVAAFEGVAGTLKHLTLERCGDYGDDLDNAEADGVLQQLGEATGKLRRLETSHCPPEITGASIIVSPRAWPRGRVQRSGR